MKNAVWFYVLFLRLFMPLVDFMRGNRSALLLRRIFGPVGHPFIKGCSLGCCRE